MLLSLSWGGREFILDVLDCSFVVSFQSTSQVGRMLPLYVFVGNYIHKARWFSVYCAYFVIWRDESVHEKKAEKSRFVAHSSRSSV